MQLSSPSKPAPNTGSVVPFTGWPELINVGAAFHSQSVGISLLEKHRNFHQAQDIVVLPSTPLASNTLKHTQHDINHDDLLSFWLRQLLNPLNRLIYITLQPLAPTIIDKHLKHLFSETFLPLRDRCILLSTHSSSYQSLAEEILKRPCFIYQIRQVLKPDCAVMFSHNSTRSERELAMTLGIPLFANKLDLLY